MRLDDVSQGFAPSEGKSALLRASWLVYLAPLAVFLSSVYWLYRSYAPVPFMDQWLVASLYRDWQEGSLSVERLLSLHNEHRIFVARIIFLADGLLFEGRNLLNLAVIFVAQLAAAALFTCALYTRSRQISVRIGTALAVLMMFSLAQWENLFWGFQVQFVAVFCAGAWSIYMFSRADGSTGAKRIAFFGASALLLLFATFNMANGVFAGFAVVGAAALSRRPLIPSVAMMACSLLLLALYLHGYEPVDGHSDPSFSLTQPIQFLVYVFVYLGGPFSAGNVPVAAVIGAFGVGSSLAMAFTLWRISRPSAVEMTMMGIVLFVGMSAAVTALGRMNFGIEQALSPRYATPSLYMWSAQVVFWSLMLQNLRWWSGALAGGAVASAMAVLLVVQVAAAEQLMIVHERPKLGAAVLSAGVEDKEALRRLHPDPNHVIEQGAVLRRLGLAFFADTPIPAMGQRLTYPIRNGPESCFGALDVVAPAPEGAPALRALGWGWDTKAGRPLGRIVLTTSERLVGVGFGGLNRDDVPAAVSQVRSRYSGWIASVAVVAPAEIVVAYALTRDGYACEIGRLSSEPAKPN